MSARAFAALGVCAAIVGCGGGVSRTAPAHAGDAPCDLTADRPVAWRAARCLRAADARVLGITPDPRGGVIVSGTFTGDIGFESPLAFAGRNAFVASLAPDLSTRWRARLDAPGALRGVAADARGVAIVTGSPDPPEGPFFTRFDGSGAIVARKDLQLGGFSTSLSATRAGTFLLRHQTDGVRVVTVDAMGGVGGAARITPDSVHDFPASLEENALVADLVVLPDGGAVTPVMLGPAPEPGAPEVGLARLAPNGAVLWSRGLRVGRRAQIAAVPGGFVLLSSDPTGVCKTADGRGAFAVVRVDLDARVTNTRCFTGRTSDVRLATREDGTAIVAGQFEGSLDLGDGGHARLEGTLGSFVVALGPDGTMRGPSIGVGDSVRFVAIEALAVARDGAIVIAGVSGTQARSPRMATVFVATLAL
jgi:hypothetical protein